MLEQERMIVIILLNLSLQMRKPEIAPRWFWLSFLMRLDASYNESRICIRILHLALLLDILIFLYLTS